MALASGADVEARLRRTLTSDEDEWVEGDLAEASGIVEGYCGTTWADDAVPEQVRIVVSRMVANLYASRSSSDPVPASAESVQRTAGPYGATVHYSADSSAGGVWLTKALKRRLRAYRVGGGVFSVDLTPCD